MVATQPFKRQQIYQGVNSQSWLTSSKACLHSIRRKGDLPIQLLKHKWLRIKFKDPRYWKALKKSIASSVGVRTFVASLSLDHLDSIYPLCVFDF